ncbi:MAG: APC family permease [Thermoplasmatota archaeon]
MGGAADPAPVASLRRELGLLDVTTLAAGSMIGAGIFFAPQVVAQAFPSPWIMALVWLAGGIVSLAGALSMAELTTMFPVSGGPYVFVRNAYGDRAGFLSGWAMLLGKLFVGPAVALVFARYVAFLVPVSTTGVLLLAIWAIVAVTFANWLSLRLGAAVQTLSTILKIAALVTVMLLALLFAMPGSPLAGSATTPSVSAAPAAAAPGAVALVTILFAYNSWFNPTFVAEEVRDPSRDLPRGLALGVIIVTVVYVAASAADWILLGTAGMAGSATVAADAASRALPWGGALVAGGVMLSTFGNLNGGTLVTARLEYAMAQGGHLPQILGRVSRRGTPAPAIITTAALAVGLVVFVDFQSLVGAGVFVTWLFLAFAVASIFSFRRSERDAPRPYRTWGYPLTPIVFLAGTGFVLAFEILSQPTSAGLGVGALALGLISYEVVGIMRRRREVPTAPGGAAEGVPLSKPL